MNWEAFGAIGEVVGAIAVVITLLFLIAQLRQNTHALDVTREATIAQLYQSRAQLHMEGILRKAEAYGFKAEDVIPKIQAEGFDSLSPSEQMYVFHHEYADAVRLDNGLFLYDKGFMDDDFHEYIERVILGKKQLWQTIGLISEAAFRRGFVEDVQRIWNASDA